MLKSDFAILVYGVVVGFSFFGIWFFYDQRDHRRFEIERRKATFHCIRCGGIYSESRGTSLCSCPFCGHENGRLRF